MVRMSRGGVRKIGKAGTTLLNPAARTGPDSSPRLPGLDSDLDVPSLRGALRNA
jgi:hypothetical protein